MIRTTLKLCVVISIVSPSRADATARKTYSLEQESMKLYGQDFQTVLKRFRRTPDYLKILQDKLTEIKTATKEIGLQIFHYTHGKMEDRVNEIIPTSSTPAGIRTREDKQDVFFHSNSARREMMFDPSAPLLDAIDKDWEEGSEAKINNLDNYKVFSSELSVNERNSMKDLGFELAGSIIHTMFQHLNVPKPEQHTEAPEEPGAKAPSTTEHPKQHEVHHETTMESPTEPEETHTVTPIPSTLIAEHHPAPEEKPSQRARLKDIYYSGISTHTIYIG